MQSIGAKSDAIQLPPPLSSEHRVSAWGSKGAGPLVLSHNPKGSATTPSARYEDHYDDIAISKQLQLYRDQRIQETSRQYGGHSTTNATSWMMCPQTYGGIGLNLTLSKGAALP